LINIDYFFIVLTIYFYLKFKAQLLRTYKLVLKMMSSKEIPNICKCLDG